MKKKCLRGFVCTLKCRFGLHSDAISYMPNFISDVAVCTRCGRVCVVQPNKAFIGKETQQ